MPGAESGGSGVAAMAIALQMETAKAPAHQVSERRTIMWPPRSSDWIEGTRVPLYLAPLAPPCLSRSLPLLERGPGLRERPALRPSADEHRELLLPHRV